MLIGKRLREIREAKNLSQGDIEHRTGLMRCYDTASPVTIHNKCTGHSFSICA
jgi:transcriptional regulator with XRE-family HTH domain